MNLNEFWLIFIYFFLTASHYDFINFCVIARKKRLQSLQKNVSLTAIFSVWLLELSFPTEGNNNVILDNVV